MPVIVGTFEAPSSVLTGDLGHRAATLLGQTDAAFVNAADHAAGLITAMARSYTRGNGFDGDRVHEDVAAVVVTATARLLANPEQIAHQVGGVAMRGGFTGWTLAEGYVLGAFRRRAS